MADREPTTDEMRQFIRRLAYGVPNPGRPFSESYHPCQGVVRAVLRVVEDQGLSGEDTYVRIAYYALQQAQAYSRLVIDHASLYSGPVIAVKKGD